jgi:light-harvesting protein B-800-850 alpha chain
MADIDGQAKIWLVVNPAVGLPLFLGAVAVTALLVHAAVLNKTTWFPSFIEGGKAKIAATTVAPAVPAVVLPEVKK